MTRQQHAGGIVKFNGDVVQGIDAELYSILDNYFYYGLHPGSFYKAVIHNDLRAAMTNSHALIDVKATIESVDRYMIGRKIDMEFLKDKL